MTTEALLFFGVGAAVVFLAVVLIEGWLRPGYDPIYHTGSELELGQRGWIQRGNFFLMGAGVLALAVGVERSLDTVVGAMLLAIFGFGLIVAGVFPPDAIRGFPPGAPTDPSASLTWQHRVHHLIGGPVAFLALLGACITLVAHFEGWWRIYTILTAIAGFGMTAATALAFQKDARKTGLIQRGLLVVYWTWIVLVGIHLATGTPQT